MKVLTATKATQGDRASDFFWSTPGELVYPAEPCDRDTGSPDGGCGCQRSFTGMDSNRGTTTARVRELPGMMLPEFVKHYIAAQRRAGWVHDAEAEAGAADFARELARLAESFPVGATLERRGDRIRARA